MRTQGTRSIIRDPVPATDAQKCDTEVLLQNFRPPPGLNRDAGRSILLVGGRGSGKTYYLRHCRHTHSGVATIGDLKSILNPITRDVGGAGLSFDLISPSVESMIRAKTAALLCAWVAEEALDRGITAPVSLLGDVFPAGWPIPDRPMLSAGKIRLDDFANLDNVEGFLHFFQKFAEVCQAGGGPLLLLLDRAEDVPYPCLTILFSLLDQSHPFATVLACRPGILVPSNPASSSANVVGDHHDIHHIGVSPYCAQWQNYAESVLEAWVPNALKQLPRETIDLVLRLSRDSLRTAVKLVYNAIDESSGRFTEDAFAQFLHIKRDILLKAAQGHLRHMNDRLSGLPTEIRQGIEPFRLPVLLELPPRHHRQLSFISALPQFSPDERFVRLALRCGFFTTKHGESWNPYAEITEVEIPPIFILREGDQWNYTPATN